VSATAGTTSTRAPVDAAREALDRAALERAWSTPPGFLGWLTSANH